MKYEIIKYTPDLKYKVIDLQRYHWNTDVRLNAAYLEWKYHRNPYLKEPMIYLAVCDGEVVGMRGVYGAQWQFGRPCQSKIIPCIGDTVLAPEHRNRALLTEIMKEALNDLARKDYSYILNLSAGRITMMNYLAMGWCGIGSLQELHSTDGIHRQSGTRPLVKIDKTPRPEAMAALVERISGDGRICHVRDAQYFSWRFRDPLRQFRFLFWQDSDLQGYLVLQKSIDFGRIKISIVDWEAMNMAVKADLLQAALLLQKSTELRIWTATLSEMERKLLRDAGFTDSQQYSDSYYPTILVKSISEERLKDDWMLADQHLLELANWDVRKIYSDAT